jgi:hypothetical protein
MFDCPIDAPKDNPAALWRLQNLLLREAEAVLGPRDASKKIFQPVINSHGPRIRNTPTLDGAFVELGINAGVYWPTTIYEMAHETVHLLNPITGYTNWLEEGVAVDFSLYAQPVFTTAPLQSPTLESYQRALQLVRSIPRGSFLVAKAVRAGVGALSLATPEALIAASPTIDETLAKALCAKCIPR